MATRKNAEQNEQVNPAEGQEEEQTQTAAEEPMQAQEKPKDPWQEMVSIFVPRKAKGDDQTWLVIVNDRYHGVPANGRMQTLPRPVAEILQDAIDAETAAADYMDRITREAQENAQKMM